MNEKSVPLRGFSEVLFITRLCRAIIGNLISNNGYVHFRTIHTIKKLRHTSVSIERTLPIFV